MGVAGGDGVVVHFVTAELFHISVGNKKRSRLFKVLQQGKEGGREGWTRGREGNGAGRAMDGRCACLF